MKRNLLSFIVLALSATVNAQVASWLIPPHYDDINKVMGADLIIADSLNRRILWDYQGKRVYETAESMFSFRDEVAVVTKGGTTAMLGIVSARGEFIPVQGFHVIHDYPYFSDGFLAVKKENERYCHFLDRTGNVAIQNCIDAFPFNHGFAKCDIYQQTAKKRGITPVLLDTRGLPVKLSVDGKDIDDGEVSFLSSVNDEGIAVVVARQRVYLFSAADRQLHPVVEGSHVQVDGDAAKFLQQAGDGYELTAKGGGGRVVFRFDNRYIPTELIANGTTTTYTARGREEWNPATTLEVRAKGDLYGIYRGKKEILPPQFTDCPTCFDNKALVSVNGKYGLLQVSNFGDFEFSMNKGNDIAFRHQRTETTIRLDIPFPVATETIGIKMPPESGCEIDVTSREAKTTSHGSSVVYYCTLTIPQTLDDETHEIQYQAQAVYDGLVSAPVPFVAKEWYYKYFNIDVDDVETTINKGNLFFTFNISADKQPGEEDYPSTVSVKSGNLPVNLEKLSETRYRCSVTGLHEGVNQVIIQIQEPGCPPSEYPFEVTYTKPVPKTTDKAAVKEKVIIKNNSKPRRQAPPQTTKKPRLEI